MKKFLLLTLFLLSLLPPAMAQNNQVRICTEQDIPANLRSNYHIYAGRMLESFYSALPFCIENTMIQDDIKANHFFNGQARYTPDFKPEDGGQPVSLTPSQYIQEFLKHYSSYRDEDLTLEISDVTFEPGFYAPNMVSCYVIADYTLTVKAGDRTLLSRPSRAYCIFPSSSNWISVKLMQITPDQNTIRQEASGRQVAVGNAGTISGKDRKKEGKRSPYREAYEHAKQAELEAQRKKEEAQDTIVCIMGRVNENNIHYTPLPGAVITVAGSNLKKTADDRGDFVLEGVQAGCLITVTCEGYRDYTFAIDSSWDRKYISIPMVRIQTGNVNSSLQTASGSDDDFRKEKVHLVGDGYLKTYSVCCASFGIRANADYMKKRLHSQGYNKASVVFNQSRNMYRVIIDSYDTPHEARNARDAYLQSSTTDSKVFLLKALP